MSHPSVVFITGASSGLGAAFAQAYAKRGSSLALFARRLEVLEQVAGPLRGLGVKVACFKLDVGDREACLEAFGKAITQLGTPDLVIASAGVALPNAIFNYHAATTKQMMDVNLYGVLHTFEAVTPSMIAKKSGQIVVLSSMASVRGLPTGEIYSASKAAVNQLCEGFRVQLLRHNVFVTTLCPGYIETPMTEKNAFPMPMKLTLDKGIAIMMKAIDKKQKRLMFPKLLWAGLHISRLIPDPLLEKWTRKGVDKVNRFLAKQKN